MILPQTAEYALRAMAQMAVLPPGDAVRAADLSKMTKVPVHYLAKIMRRLVARGLLVSEKGHGGGFKLAKSPKKLRFIDVLLALDIDLEANHCAFGWAKCSANAARPSAARGWFAMRCCTNRNCCRRRRRSVRQAPW